MASYVAPGSLWGEEGTYDSVLLSIMKSCGKIQPFFECIFSFLSRRTDFYILMEGNHSEMGFPPGVALNMVIQAFKKFEVLTRKREAELMREAETRRIDLMTDDLTEQPKIDVVSSTLEQLSKLTKFETEKSLALSQVQPSRISNTMPTTQAVMSSLQKSENNVLKFSEFENVSPPKPALSPTSDTPLNKKPSAKPDSITSTDSTQIVESIKSKSIANIESSSATAEISSDAYNGANNENYVWSQTMTDLDIRVPVRKGTTGKDLKVYIKNDSLKVEILSPEQLILLDGKLLYRVKVEESMWSLDKEAGVIHVNMEKNKEIMWKSVFQGEKGIDLTKVDTSRDISEFDQESQAAIQKVTYDHHMKMLGKPTSNEQKAHDILKKAWDAPGSPFKGTPFDPSKVNIAGVW